MYFEQFYLGCLAHASYMVGSQGVAAVVDPQRDIQIYLDEAARHHLRISWIIETHLHADFISGHAELAAATGARILVSHRAGASYPHLPVADGQEISLGNLHLRFLETPGHTPESICVLLTDLDSSPKPFAVLTGDTLFIGDVGRPDLSPDFSPQELAGMLYDSLHAKLLTLPDDVLVYPAHGAGSLCGRNISADRFSTIGLQRASNYALQPMPRADFIRLLTSAMPLRPSYFQRDAEINRRGAASLASSPALPSLAPLDFLAAQRRGALVLDTRSSDSFSSSHVPGSLHISLSGQFASWAGILIGLDQPVLLVAEDDERLAEARMRLARVGIENVIGSLQGGMPSWQAAGLPADGFPQISVEALRDSLRSHPGNWQILDVRRPAEWDAGHIQGALLAPLDSIREHTPPLDPHRPVAIHCKSGYRSSIAASLLQAAGFSHVMNVTGGFDAWHSAGFPSLASELAQAPPSR